jgi:transcriptional regulator NrdR family protein
MHCPNQKCKNKETRVREVLVYQTFKYRVRMCPVCGTFFQTHENYVEDSIVLCNYEPLQAELPFFAKPKQEEK